MNVELTHNEEQEDIDYLKTIIKPTMYGLWRHVDVSGVSGTGFVAIVVEWLDGSVLMRWRGDYPSYIFYPSIAVLMSIHGHDGNSELIRIDE